MPNLRHRLRSDLSVTTEFNNILSKVGALFALSPRHVVIQKGSYRASAADLQNVVLDPLNAHPVQFKRPPFSAGAASLTLQDLTYTAQAAGAAGNSITIHYTTGGTAGAEAVTVVGSAITVQIASGVSTATQVKAAIDGNGSAHALVAVAISGTGSNAQTAPVSATNLAGGYDASTVEKYDESDVQIIRRLRTKKWLVKILATAVSK